MAHDRKQPKARFEPDVTKAPRTREDPNSYLKLPPSWRIGKIDMMGPFGWHTVEKAQLREIHDHLRNLEKSTWDEIFLQSKKQNHGVPVDSLKKSARDRLKELRLDDQEVLHCLRLSGVERVWGIFSLGVMTILWWDPNHEVCPSEKKHT